jgi:hypothetical protein
MPRNAPRDGALSTAVKPASRAERMSLDEGRRLESHEPRSGLLLLGRGSAATTSAAALATGRGSRRQAQRRGEIDEPGVDGAPGEIEDAGIRRSLHVGADRGDQPVPDDNGAPLDHAVRDGFDAGIGERPGTVLGYRVTSGEHGEADARHGRAQQCCSTHEQAPIMEGQSSTAMEPAIIRLAPGRVKPRQNLIRPIGALR